MTYRFEQILTDLLTAFGESFDPSSMPQAGDFPAGHPLPEMRMMKTFLPSIAAGIILEAPLQMCDAIPLECHPIKLDDCSGRIPLPADFLRLAAFRMPDWRVTLSECSAESSLLDAIGRNPPPILQRMSMARPPAISIKREGEALYLYYSGTSAPSDHPSEASYAEIPRWHPDGSIRLPRLLYDRIIETTANRIKRVFE